MIIIDLIDLMAQLAIESSEHYLLIDSQIEIPLKDNIDANTKPVHLLEPKTGRSDADKID